MMNTIRKLIYRPKKSDTSYLAQFYYADEQLNLIATELDSFDGRKDPERCTALVSQLRHSQDEVLAIIEKIMVAVVPERLRAARDYRVKFPDDVLHDSLAGQLWFGAECLAAGSSIMNREVESASMRPLAKSLTRHLDSLRTLLREQCLRNQNVYSEKIIESLIDFDKIFAEFELSYVSAMVPVKTMREYDLLQDVTVLFCETVQRALRLNLLTQEMIDAYEPALMFTIPRLAIVCGLLVFPDGPINPDMDPLRMCEMFRPFQTLLYKIRELLWTLNDAELHTLETTLCTTVDESEQSSALLVNLSTNDIDIDETEPSTSMVHSESTMTVVAVKNGTLDDNSDDTSSDSATASVRSKTLPEVEARQLQHSLSWPQSADNQRISAGDSPTSSSSSSAIALCGAREFILSLPCNTSLERLSSATQPNHSTMNATNEGGIIYLSTGVGDAITDNGHQITFITDEFCRLFATDINEDIEDVDESLDNSAMTTGMNCEARTSPLYSSSSCNSGTENTDCTLHSVSSSTDRSALPADGISLHVGATTVSKETSRNSCCLPPPSSSSSRSSKKLHCRNVDAAIDAAKTKNGRRGHRSGFPRSIAQSWSGVDVSALRTAASSMNPGINAGLDIGLDHESCCSSDTSSYSSESRDDEEIALAIQAAEAAARQEARSRFKNAADLIHRLFVCISGVADQLQTNYATDLRHILKIVFECNTSEAVAQLEAAEDMSYSSGASRSDTVTDMQLERRSRSRDPPNWVPDTDSDVCMACHTAFTFVKRRHHCRNCGKLFCAHCSSNAVPLPHYGHEKPVRVCNHCFVFHVTPFTMTSATAERPHTEVH